MVFRLSFAILLLFAAAARAETCEPLKLITDVQMLSGNGGHRWMVPVTINGTPKLMRLGTASFISSLSPEAVKALHIETYDTGHSFEKFGDKELRREISIDDFQIGTLSAKRKRFLVSADGMSDLDGILANEFLLAYDLDMDFGTGHMKYFSPNHCPGKVVYWSPADVTAIPLTVENRTLIRIPVTLDGETFNAIIDTGSPYTMITDMAAKRLFKLTADSAGMRKVANANGKPNLPIFAHVFQSLDFGGVKVSNPNVLISPLPADRGKLPDMTLGTNVLRHLHIYLAFKEQRLYVSATSQLSEGLEDLSFIEKAVTLSPENPALLNQSCFLHGVKKMRLEKTLDECDRALNIRPQDPHFMDSKALVLYQLGRYRDALELYNQVLAVAPRQEASLYMRGHAKKKLGDASAGDADIAAAKALNGNVEAEFVRAGLVAD